MRAYSTIPTTLAMLGVLLSSVTANTTGGLLDQSFVPKKPNVVAGIRGDLGEFAQTFQVGIDGVLCRVDVLVANEQPSTRTGNLYFDVRPTIDGIPVEDNTAVLASGTVPISILHPRPNPALISFDVASFGVHVAVGDVLAIVLRSDPGTDVGWYGLDGNPYPLGVPFARGGSGEWQRDDSLDLGFQTFVAPFPNPGAMSISIDIKPGSDSNPLNPETRGVIRVAILTTNTFDATTVDPLSVQFGPDGATEAHGRGHIEDANGDGELDLVLHFNTQETGIGCSDTSASIMGKTFNGQAIEGFDSIKTVGCKTLSG